MAYTFYMGSVMLPVPPAQLQLSIRNQNVTVTLIDEGEINIPKKPGLSEISFKVLIPQMQYPFARYEGKFKPAEFYLNYFKKLKVDQLPFQFIVARSLPSGTPEVDLSNKEKPVTIKADSLFGTNIKVLLEDYKIIEDAGNGLDVDVEINLKQFRDYGTKTVKIEEPTPEQPNPTAQVNQTRSDETAPKAKTHTVVKGDTLWAIAQKYLNNGNRYPEIYSMNQAVIDAKNKGTKNTKYTIYPGQILKLP